jgi:hypothetical protein
MEMADASKKVPPPRSAKARFEENKLEKTNLRPLVTQV